MLVGNRLRLRAITEADCGRLYMWRGLPENAYEYFYECEPLSYEKQLSWQADIVDRRDEYNFAAVPVDAYTKEFERFDISDTDASGIVGMACITNIDWRNSHAEYGRLVVGPGHYGKNYGREIEDIICEYVFNHLGMNRFYCEVLASNPRVIKLHEDSGFKVEGVYRKHIFKSGEFVDVVYMGMLCDEWKGVGW